MIKKFLMDFFKEFPHPTAYCQEDYNRCYHIRPNVCLSRCGGDGEVGGNEPLTRKNVGDYAVG